MIISYLGKQHIKIQQGDLVISVNPPSKESSFYGNGKFGADIVLSSINHKDFNGIDEAKYGDRVPFSITGPGEYEVKDVEIVGAYTKTFIDGKEFANSIYRLNVEGIVVVIAGVLSKDSFTSALKEQIGTAHILVLPISGGDDFGVKEAEKMAVSLEPSIVIPVDYKEDVLSSFIKSSGFTVEKLDKLTVKKKDVLEKNGVVVVLDSK